ncbi:MAG: hypothetical protein NWQ55_04080 [Salibacteraceae bacterium]|nr:hypothetical protein [Salibacteraceae bacterium]MDP4843975.1 hypothetical protein [Salibacteraceae bacterium]MDP4964229.1 hypothetical protein [Salibacteraceae bacterium]
MNKTSDLSNKSASEGLAPITENPFPGLRSYTEKEAVYFTGRRDQKYQLLKRLISESFVSIIGDPGVGKTSFVYCEIFPELKKGYLSRGKQKWKIIPLKSDNKPISSLAIALSSLELTRGETETEVAPDLSDGFELILRNNKLGIIEIIEKYHLAQDANLLLFIDDLEELLVQSDPADASIFVERILEVSSQNVYPIHILTASRSKLGSGFSGLQEFSELINRSQFVLSPFSTSEVKTLIENIMNSSNIEFRTSLIEYIMKHYTTHVFDLSKFQHAMMRCVQQVKNESNSHTLGLVHLQSIGGLENSIEVQLESIFQSFTERQQFVCQKIFQAISGITPTGIKYLESCTLEDLSNTTGADIKEVTQVIAPFLDADCGALAEIRAIDIVDRLERLAFTSAQAQANTGLTTRSKIKASREIMIKAWPRFDQWIDDEWSSAKIYMFIADSAEKKAHPLEGESLRINWDWYESYQPQKNWALRYHSSYNLAIDFLKKSKELAEEKIEIRKAEEESRQRKATRNKAIVAVLLLVSVLLLGYSGMQTKDALVANNKARDAENRAQFSTSQAISDSIKAVSARERALLAIEKADDSQKLADMAESEAKDAIEKANRLKAESSALVANIETKEADLKQASDKIERSKILEEYINLLTKTREFSDRALKQIGRTEDKVLLKESAVTMKSAFELFETTKAERFRVIRDSLSELSIEAERRLYSGINRAIQSINDDSKLKVIEQGVASEKVVSLDQGGAFGVFNIVSNNGTGEIFNVKIRKSEVESVSKLPLVSDAKSEPWAIKCFETTNDKAFFLFAQYPTAEKSNRLELHKMSGELASSANSTELFEDLFSIGENDFFGVDQKANISFIKIDSGQISSIKIVHKNQSELTSVTYNKQKNIGLITKVGTQIQLFGISNTGQVETLLAKKLADVRNEISASVIIPSKKWFVIGDRNGELYVFSSEDGSFIYKFTAEHENIITSLALSPDERFLASGDRNGKINIWNLNEVSESIQVANSLPQIPIQFQEKFAIQDIDFVNRDWIIVVAKNKGFEIGEKGEVSFLPIQFELAGQELIKLTK